MKKEQASKLKVIKAEDLPAIATTADPLAGGRIPEGVEVTRLPGIVEVPKTERMQAWPAILFQYKDEYYPMGLRTYLGLGFQDKILKKVADTNAPTGALMDTVANEAKCVIKEYVKASVDIYGKDEQTPKSFPVFEWK